MGIEDQIIFPEIDPDKIKVTQGMNITEVTSARTDDEARALFDRFPGPVVMDASPAVLNFLKIVPLQPARSAMRQSRTAVVSERTMMISNSRGYSNP